MRDVGDRIAVRHEVRDPDGALTGATVTIAVTRPDGTLLTPAPAVTTPSLGIYDAAFTADTAGVWRWTWTVTGAVVDVAHGSVDVRSDPDVYATLDELKGRIDINPDDTIDDDDLTAALDSVSRDIESWCGRVFSTTWTASARRYRPLTGGLVMVDDIWTDDGLIVETSTDGSTWQTWDTSDYELEPTDGIVDGRPGWPYCRIRAVGSRTFPCVRRTSVRVTARWGWAAVPTPVKEACLILASESLKLSDAPFGVAGFNEFGPVRVRNNPFAQAKLAPYRRNPVLVA